MTLTIELPPETEKALKARADAAGLPVERYARQALERHLEATKLSSEDSPEAERPISEMIQEILGDVPPEELEKLPKDGASQIDHYVYGLPKRDP